MLVLTQISSHGGLSLVHMACVTATAMEGGYLISSPITSFSSPTLGSDTSPSIKLPGFAMVIAQDLAKSLTSS